MLTHHLQVHVERGPFHFATGDVRIAWERRELRVRGKDAWEFFTIRVSGAPKVDICCLSLAPSGNNILIPHWGTNNLLPSRCVWLEGRSLTSDPHSRVVHDRGRAGYSDWLKHGHALPFQLENRPHVGR